MTHPAPSTGVDLVALVGLVLMLVVTRLAIRGYSAPQIKGRGLSSFLARRAIDGVAAIGWLADRLPLGALNGGSR